MDFIDLAKKRYSVRKFDGKPVPKKTLDKILEAGRIAPTAKNIQPQKVYVINSAEGIKKINSVCQCIYGATTVLLVCYDKSIIWNNPFKPMLNTGFIDTSIVLTHMMLEAADLGVDSCWVEYFDPDQVKKEFALPENIVPAALMPMGFAAKGVVPSENHTSKKPIDETVDYI